MSDSVETSEGAEPCEAERKAREMVAVAEYLCTHQPDVSRTPLLLDRLSYNVEQCLMDGAKTTFGALVFGRLPLYTLVCESPAVVAASSSTTAPSSRGSPRSAALPTFSSLCPQLLTYMCVYTFSHSFVHTERITPRRR